MNVHATSPQHGPNALIPFHDESVSIGDSSATVPTPLVGMGLPTLEVWSNGEQPRRIYVLTKDILQLGRDPANDIVLHSTAASDFHAQIVRQGEMLMFVHPHPARSSTSNGLFYKGRHIPGHEVFRKPLVRGDIFRISDEHGGYLTLVFNDGSNLVQSIAPILYPIPLTTKLLTIGRNHTNTIVLNHSLVSGCHAYLVQDNATYRIRDQKSTNHVYVNGQRVIEQALVPNDEIGIGPFVFTFTGTHLLQYTEQRGIHIDAVHVQQTVRRFLRPAEVLLKDISLSIPPQSMVAIIGGSGAGKSTLMNALNGAFPARDGHVFYDGQDYYRSLELFNTQLGYVPQDDIVHRELTVGRALYYAARLRLPGKATDRQIRRRVENVLQNVDMLDKRHMRIRKLSGGQRKRLSVALELLVQPHIFYLDEPTSGLDPGLDRKLMFILRSLADEGRTVVLTTHSVQNLYICDYICLLTPGGRLAFFGPPEEALRYFGTRDFVELYSHVEPRSDDLAVPENAEERFRQSVLYKRYITDRQQQQLTGLQTAAAGKKMVGERHEEQLPKRVRVRVGQWRQFCFLTLRSIELLKNDIGTSLILLLQAPLIGLLLMLLIKYGIGTGVFGVDSIVQCPTSQHILTATGAIQVPDMTHRVTSISCARVVNFLQTTAVGHAYMVKSAGESKALQNFMVTGPGGDAEEVLFCMVFATLMFGCINSVREIVKEAPIYHRERAVNLGVFPYVLSKMAVLGVLCLLQSAILILLVNAVIPFQHAIFLPPLLEMYITLALVCLVGMMLGLLISAIAPSADRAMSFIPLVLIPQVVFSGAIIPFKDQFTQIFAMLSASRWGLAALGSSAGLHSETMRGDALFKNVYIFHGTLYSTYSQTDALHYLLLMWAVLGAMIVLFCGLTMYCQRRKDVRR